MKWHGQMLKKCSTSKNLVEYDLEGEVIKDFDKKKFTKYITKNGLTIYKNLVEYDHVLDNYDKIAPWSLFIYDLQNNLIVLGCKTKEQREIKLKKIIALNLGEVMKDKFTLPRQSDYQVNKYLIGGNLQ